MKNYAFLLLALAVLTAAAFFLNSSTSFVSAALLNVTPDGTTQTSSGGGGTVAPSTQTNTSPTSNTPSQPAQPTPQTPVSPPQANVVAPNGVSANALSSCAIKVIWNQASPPANPRYDAARNDSGNSVGLIYLGVNTSVESVSPLSLSFTDLNQYWSTLLNPATTHTYYVRVYDVNAGTASGWNGPATVTTNSLPAQPGTPTISSVDTSNSGTINVSWNAGTVSSIFNSYGKFVVTRAISTDGGLTYGAFSQVSFLPSSNSFYNDPVFSNDAGGYLTNSYEYKIYAREVGGEGCDPTNSQQIVDSPASVTVVVPSRPTGLAATFIPTPNREMTLTWQNHATNATQLELMRSLGTDFNPATAVSIINNLPANTTSYNDASIDVGVQTYSYAIHACSGTACSFFSDKASVTTGVSVPANVKAGIVNINLTRGAANYNTADVYLSWTGDVFSGYSYTIQNAVDGGAYGDVISRTDSQFLNLNGLYKSNIPLNHNYSYRIKAQAPDGSSDYSGAATMNANIRYKITGAAWGASAQLVPPDMIPPTVAMTAPANGATVSGVVQLSATASDNVGVVSVQFAVDGVNFGAALSAVPYTINWDTTAISNGSHTISVSAYDAAGNKGTASSTVTVNNVSAPVVVNPPAAPSNLNLVSVGNTFANIAWTDNSVAPDSATYFNVQRMDFGPVGTNVADQTWLPPFEVPRATSYSDTGLTSNYIYEYKVQACNNGGCSGFSNVLVVITSSGTTTTTTTTGGGGNTCSSNLDCSSGEVCVSGGINPGALGSISYCQPAPQQTQ